MVKVEFFQGLSLACLVGLLLFLKWDFSMGLLVCLLSLAAIFFGEGGFFQGLSLACLVGLLLFLKLDLSVGLLVCLLSLAAIFFVKVDFFRACHWPAWSACCFS